MQIERRLSYDALVKSVAIYFDAYINFVPIGVIKIVFTNKSTVTPLTVAVVVLRNTGGI